MLARTLIIQSSVAWAPWLPGGGGRSLITRSTTTSEWVRVPQVVRRWPQLIPNRCLGAPTPGDRVLTAAGSDDGAFLRGALPSFPPCGRAAP